MPRLLHPTRLNFSRTLGICLSLLLAGLLSTPARAAGDMVQFGNTIEVGPEQTIHDAVCFFCGVDVKGTVNGDIVAFFGSVNIEGQANHDVVDFFGDVKVADGASIGHDMVNFFGEVRLGENASVGKDAVVMFGSLRAAPSVSFGGSRVVEPGWVFWGPFLALTLGIYFLVSELRNYRRRRLMGGF